MSDQERRVVVEVQQKPRGFISRFVSLIGWLTIILFLVVIFI